MLKQVFVCLKASAFSAVNYIDALFKCFLLTINLYLIEPCEIFSVLPIKMVVLYSTSE